MSTNILDDLRSLGNSEIAKHSQSYFKTAPGEYGAGDLFLGLRMPIIRNGVKKYIATSLNDISVLITNEYHEVRLFSAILLVEQYKIADTAKKALIFDFYLANTEFVNYPATLLRSDHGASTV